MSTEMSIFEHINELRSRILHIVISLVIITIFSMSIGIKPITIDLDGNDNNNNNANTLKLYYPYPDPFGNFALQLTKYMQNTLLPPEVKLIQTAPGQAFFANVYVSLLIGIIGSMPIIIKEIYGFISPAIGKHTKIRVMNVFVPTLSLFIIGISFSYIIVIPFTLNFLYDYGRAIGVETFLNINEFISFVLQFFLGFGIAFELPVVMYAISLTGAVDSKFWRKNFRYAVIILVVFGALITPDGSGITMWFLALPMIIIYLLGMLAIRRREKKKTLEIL
jgi:sec-independent protein translocase protein TatC